MAAAAVAVAATGEAMPAAAQGRLVELGWNSSSRGRSARSTTFCWDHGPYLSPKLFRRHGMVGRLVARSRGSSRVPQGAVDAHKVGERASHGHGTCWRGGFRPACGCNPCLRYLQSCCDGAVLACRTMWTGAPPGLCQTSVLGAACARRSILPAGAQGVKPAPALSDEAKISLTVRYITVFSRFHGRVLK